MDALTIEEREEKLAKDRADVESARKAVRAERERLEGVAKEVDKAKSNEPLKTGGGFYIPSTFDNVTAFTFGGLSIGGITNIMITPRYKRVEPTTNDSYSGPIASHIVDKTYEITVETEDFAAVALISSAAAPQTVTFTHEAVPNPIGTPTLAANQTVSLSACVFDPSPMNFKVKATGTITIHMHTLGNVNNSDQFTY